MRQLSEILKEERVKKGLSVEDVVSSIKIRKSFIYAIEEGKFKSLPSEAYALGFVKNYARFLGIPESRATALFRREYEEVQAETAPKFRKAISHSKDAFSLRSARGVIVLVVVVVILSYLAFQFRFLVFGPELEVLTPAQNTIAESNVVVVSGKTEPSATVSVNGEVVYVDLSGSFRKTVYVEEDQDIEVISRNRSGRETRKTVFVQTE